MIELLVVIAITALLMSILMPALYKAKEQGKRSVCLNHQRQLAAAWFMCSDDSRGKIVNGWTGDPDSWAGAVHAGDDAKTQIAAIKAGAIFPYCKNVRIFKCPTGERGEALTYAPSSAMNGGHEGTGPVAKTVHVGQIGLYTQRLVKRVLTLIDLRWATISTSVASKRAGSAKEFPYLSRVYSLPIRIYCKQVRRLGARSDKSIPDEPRGQGGESTVMPLGLRTTAAGQTCLCNAVFEKVRKS